MLVKQPVLIVLYYCVPPLNQSVKCHEIMTNEFDGDEVASLNFSPIIFGAEAAIEAMWH